VYKVVQWATGSMGRTALRRIIDHPDLELTGLFVYDERKAGRDAGEIARRGPTGVIATTRVEDILALDADVVIHTPRISLPYEKQNGDVERLLASGKNVISTAGFHFPQAHGEAYARPLRAACLAGGSTLAGLGLNPGFIAERVAVLMTGMCAQVEAISSSELADASAMPSPEFVFGTMGFGADPAQDDITKGPLAGLYGALYSETFAYVAQALGTHVARLAPDHRVTLAPGDISIAAGIVRKGTVAATEWRWHGEFADGRRMTHSVRLDGRSAASRGEARGWRALACEYKGTAERQCVVRRRGPRSRRAAYAGCGGCDGGGRHSRHSRCLRGAAGLLRLSGPGGFPCKVLSGPDSLSAALSFPSPSWRQAASFRRTPWHRTSLHCRAARAHRRPAGWRPCDRG